LGLTLANSGDAAGLLTARINVAKAVAKAAPTLLTNTGAIAAAVASTFASVDDKASMANAVVADPILTAQAVAVATAVALPLTAVSEKAQIAVAVATAAGVPQNSTTVGAPAVAKAVAAQIAVG